MARWTYRILLVAISLMIWLIAVGWMVLAAPLFSDFRQDRVANVLTEQLGHLVEILGDVSVTPGRVSKRALAQTSVRIARQKRTRRAQL